MQLGAKNTTLTPSRACAAQPVDYADSMITFSLENPAEIIPLIPDLIRDNWAETGFDFECLPNIELYDRMFQAGVMICVVAKLDNLIIGYCNLVFSPHPYNPAVIVCGNDVIFLAKAHRNAWVSGRLIQRCEAVARECGASKMVWHCRAGSPLADMFRRHGYHDIDVLVGKDV